MGVKSLQNSVPPKLGAASTPIDWDYEYSLQDKNTGLLYVLNPALVDLHGGVTLYDYEQHSHLFQYVTQHNITYTNVPELVNWDNNVEEWCDAVNGLWPFGNSIPDDYSVYRESIMVIDDLICFLDSEIWIVLVFAEDLTNAGEDVLVMGVLLLFFTIRCLLPIPPLSSLALSSSSVPSPSSLEDSDLLLNTLLSLLAWE